MTPVKYHNLILFKVLVSKPREVIPPLSMMYFFHFVQLNAGWTGSYILRTKLHVGANFIVVQEIMREATTQGERHSFR